jgi:hypothetical protein
MLTHIGQRVKRYLPDGYAYCLAYQLLIRTCDRNCSITVVPHISNPWKFRLGMVQ